MTTLTKAICIGLTAATIAFPIGYWMGKNSPRWELERRLRAEGADAPMKVFSCAPTGDGWSMGCWSAFAAYVLFFTPSYLLFSNQDHRDAGLRREFMKRIRRRTHSKSCAPAAMTSAKKSVKGSPALGS